MHWSRGGGILTSSKDGATCVSRLADDLGTGVSLNDKKVTHQTETETKPSNGVFVVERRIDDAHVGVVKCARWRMCPTLSSCGDGGDDALFATCGNDGRVCVLDKRAKRATVATLDDAHGGVDARRRVRVGEVGARRGRGRRPRRGFRAGRRERRRSVRRSVRRAPSRPFTPAVLGRAPRVVRAGSVCADVFRRRRRTRVPSVERGRDGRRRRAVGHESRRARERSSARAFPRLFRT